MASSALQLYPYQSDSSDCKFKHGTKRILFRHAMLAEGPATLRKLLKDYLRPAVDNELRFPEVDATAFTALTQIVYDDIDGNDTDDAVWLDKTTLLPHARVYLLAREYGLLELMKTARGKLVKVLRHSRDLPMPPTGAVDLLTSIKEIFGGTTADDDNEIRIWLIRYCTCHIRELPNSHTHRDKLGEIMSEHGALGSTILLLHAQGLLIWKDMYLVNSLVSFVYVCADKYGLPELGQAAYGNIASILRGLNLTAPGADPADFVDAVRLIHERTAGPKDILRSYIVKVLVKNLWAWLRHPQRQIEIRALLTEIGEVGKDVLDFQAEQNQCCVFVRRCLDCDRPQIQHAGKEIGECSGCGREFEDDRNETSVSAEFKLYYEEQTIDFSP
nr:hypothetical protein B0A51_12826 [Rachicladosporium sp. CCFEE 5018]